MLIIAAAIMIVNKKTLTKIILSTDDNDSPSLGIKYFVRKPKAKKLLIIGNGLFDTKSSADIKLFL